MDLRRTPSHTVDALQTERTKKTCCRAYGAKLWLRCGDILFPENLVIRGDSILVLEFKDKFLFSEFVKTKPTSCLVVSSSVLFSFYFLALIQ